MTAHRCVGFDLRLVLLGGCGTSREADALMKAVPPERWAPAAAPPVAK